ncbi:MAG: hypothetical protein ACRDXC_11725 [Acidimicrobiales bacterium]
MSQHLIDSGQRISAGREDPRRHGPRDADAAGDGSARRDAIGGNGRGAGGGEPRSMDATLRALEALSDALAEISEDQQLLEQRLRHLHRQRSEGREWRDILADEEAPGTMQVVSRMLACLAKASGTLRKELVDTLRREGVSIPAIAKLFGVTHQRVSNLLRRPAE